MREINLNIEGFNVNGICVACLNYGRKMFYDKQIDHCLKLLGNIDVPEDITVQVCWECLAAMRAVDSLQQQINRSFDILLDYSRKHTYLNCPSDLYSLATQRLITCTAASAQEVTGPWGGPADPVDPERVPSDTPFLDLKKEVEEKVEVECDEYQKVEEEDYVRVKSPLDDEVYQEEQHQDNAYSSEDDMKLSAVKQEKETETKAEQKCKQEKALRHFPEGTVSIEQLSFKEIKKLREKDRVNPAFVKFKHRCDSCICTFNSYKLLQHHVKARHTASSRQATQCDICLVYMISKGPYHAHRRRHRAALRCVACGHLSAYHRTMAAHLETHAGGDGAPVTGVTCDSCQETFPSKSKLSYHRAVCRSQRPQCDCCGKVYANKATLRFHLRSQQAPKEKVKVEEDPITCKECGKVLSSKKGYRAHMEIHKGTRYPCPICGAQFAWRRNLARHAHAHAARAAGQHRCVPCGRSFASKECLSNHMKLSKRHGADNFAHACGYCAKKFPTKYALTDHVDWEHVRKIKYTCDLCRRPFKTLKVLTNHQKNIHGGRRGGEAEGSHLCEICGKSYTTVKRLKGHVWAMHTNRATQRSYRCAACPATFMWQSSVYKHFKCMHADKDKDKHVTRTMTKVEDVGGAVFETLEIAPVTYTKQYF